jgi:hypothetical protein
MSQQAFRWRETAFRCGWISLLIDLALYVASLTLIKTAGTLDKQLRVAAWCFLGGSLIALCGAILVSFGYGWKRVPLILACLGTLPFWYGLTLY